MDIDINRLVEDVGVRFVGGVALVVALVALVVVGGWLLAGDDLEDPPEVIFDVDADEGDEGVTVTHNGGDAIEGDRLHVRFDDGRMVQCPSGWDDAVVKAGDECALSAGDIGDGDAVEVVWVTDEQVVVLERFEHECFADTCRWD